jgi:hypothetical protein
MSRSISASRRKTGKTGKVRRFKEYVRNRISITKTDVYRTVLKDPVAGLQEDTGHTPGGVPFVSDDEAEEWLGLNDRDYPEWISQQKSIEAHRQPNKREKRS